ncbi:MAG TPA: sigma-54 dependent transcriptional regulator [Longimicrobiales bacterium]|nr:sigma-54 dependent transcriptional regulator [Longimicrobiales bacterium]
MRPTLLVVDDEPRIRRILELSLEDLGYRVLGAGTAAEAERALDAERVDMVITDLQLPDRSGIELLERIRTSRGDLPVILVTAFGTVESAVRAIKLGAFDYVVKPFAVEEIEALVTRALGATRAERESEYLRELAPGLESIVAAGAAMRTVLDAVERVAAASTTVLVTGETGVGKELVARAIHGRSPRAGGLFVALNCAAIPGELLEAELFGVTKGAFTGAVRDRAGKFELADGGTLFLDEIGDMPPALQPKLLRALQEGAIERLGSNAVRRVDVRIVAATHRDLPLLVEEGRFRADLFYRLNVFPIHVPPLRERPEDIAPLAAHTAERVARSLGRRTRIAPEAVRQLEAYPWPGNVRELENVVERAVLLARDDVVRRFDLPARSVQLAPAASPTGGPPAPPPRLRDAVDRAEREAILQALRYTGDNKTRAAEILGISVRTLWYKLERLALGAPLETGSDQTVT